VPVEAVKIVHDDLSYVTTSLRPKLKPEIIDAIVDEAHKQDLKVYAHAPILADAKELLRVGIDGLIHGVISDPVDDEFIELMLNKKAVYVATHAIFEAASDTVGWARREIDFDTRGWVPIEVLEFGTSRERVRQWEGRFDKLTTIKAKLPILRANVKKVFDAGVPVGESA
jgi:imidazolonepropionase-like amidohydrolase